MVTQVQVHPYMQVTNSDAKQPLMIRLCIGEKKDNDLVEIKLLSGRWRARFKGLIPEVCLS